MNPHLDELISLVKHPAIQGRRGEWLPGDCCYDPLTQSVGYYVGEYANSGGMTYTISYEHCLVYAESMDKYIWIPKLSDPIHPERGLIGMLKNLESIIKHSVNDLGVHNYECYRAFVKWNRECCEGPTPEIAVAKAIVGQ